MTMPTENQIEISLGLIYKGVQASQIRAEWGWNETPIQDLEQKN